MSEINYQLLAQAMLQQMPGITTKSPVSSTPTSTYGHGPGGLFSHPALERPVFSAMILPRAGLQARLPLNKSQFDYPLYGIFTGVTATTGDEPTGPCDDFPVAGLSKLCMQSSVFARQGRESRVFELDRIGRLTDRGEHTDFQFMGNPWQGERMMPQIPGSGDSNAVLNQEYAKMAFEMGVTWQRDFAREFYSGNPSNNTAQGGRKYYRGLDLLINTGYRDAESGQTCPAADSIVRSFGNLNISTNAATLIAQITNIYRNLKYIASGAGLDPVKWVIAMRWSTFYEITDVWPCAYLSYRCTNLATGSTQFVDSAQQIAMRDEMRSNMYERTGQYLLIDGERVEVVIDDAIEELGIGAGTFRSAIYFVPLTVLGGVPVTYMEYFPYNVANGAMDFARFGAPQGSFQDSDDGRFLWHFKPPTNYCVQFLVKTEPRLILRTPYLAARLTNVQYTPLAHEREPFTDSTYFVNGGRTDRAGYGPSYFSPATGTGSVSSSYVPGLG